MPDVAEEEQQGEGGVAEGEPAAGRAAEGAVGVVRLAVELEGFAKLGLAGQALHVSRIGVGGAVECAAVHGGRHAGLLEGVLRLSTAEGDVGTNDALAVLENHREVLEEVGQTTHLQIPTFLISEGNVTQPAGGQTIAVHHRADPEETALSRAVPHVVVEGQLFWNGGVGLLLAGAVVEGGLHTTVDLCLEVALIPLVAGGAKQLNRRGGGAVPHGSSHDEGGEEHGGNGAGEHRLDVAHAQGLVEALRRTGGDVEDASNDPHNAGGNVVSHDAARVEGVEPFRPPGRLHRLEVARDAVGV